MIIEKEEERAILIEAGKRLGELLNTIMDHAKPGVVTKDLDDMAHEIITSQGDKPAFLGFDPGGGTPFPATLCVSVNEGLVHGIPSGYILQSGDVVSFDCGIEHKGLFVDSAVTIGIGDISKEDQELIDVTKKAIQSGLVFARAGNTVGDIGAAVEETARGNGFAVAIELGGHGVGRKQHEEPFIPNIAGDIFNEVLREGEVIAIEPILMHGDDPHITPGDDGFIYNSASGKKGAHFEHTVIVNKDKAPTIITKNKLF